MSQDLLNAINALNSSVQGLSDRMADKEGGGKGTSARRYREQTTVEGIDEQVKRDLELAKGRKEMQDIENRGYEQKIRLLEKVRASMDRNEEGYEELTNQIAGMKTRLETVNKAQATYNKTLEEADASFDLVANSVLTVGSNFTFLRKAMMAPFGLLRKATSVGGVLSIVGAVLAKIASNSIEFALGVDRAASSFRKATGAGYKYNQVISNAGLAYLTYGMNAADAGKAVTDLFGSFREFSELSDSEKTNIANTTMALEKFGVSGAEAGKILDMATKSLGLNTRQSEQLLREFEMIARSVGKPISEISKDFASAMPKIAFYGAKAIDVFKELEAQSKSTGLSMDSLLKITGEQFDTFEGSGKAVGKLNALLGGPYLNSIDMLNASESERLVMLQDSLKASGTLFSDLNKFEQKAFASALGTDVDTLRRSMQELDPFQELQVMRQEELARKAGQARDILSKLKDAFNSLVIANQPFVNSIIRLIDKFSVFIQKNHDLTKIFDKHIKPKFVWLQNFIMKKVVPVVKFLADNWKWLALAWVAVKGVMASAWLWGFIAQMKAATAATVAQGAAADKAAASNARNARGMGMAGRFGMAGLGLAAGAATMAGTNYFRNKNMRGAAGAAGILGGAASGAMMGSMFGMPGALIGGAIGAAAGGIYANRDYNDVLMTPQGPRALDGADRPFHSESGELLGFGVPGGPLSKGAQGVFAPGAGGSNQQLVAMIQGLPAAIAAGMAGTTVQASLRDSIAVNPHGLLDIVNDQGGPVAQAASPFLGGSY